VSSKHLSRVQFSLPALYNSFVKGTHIVETWTELREKIGQWSKLEITDDQFYCYLVSSIFDSAADARVVAIFIGQHDRGEWSHAIYHRMR
jgi:hypothetical protein